MGCESPRPQNAESPPGVGPAGADTGRATEPAPASATSPRPSDPPGFELGDEIGRGGMGVVYHARDTALHRDVAVKLLDGKFPPDSAAARRFLDEAQITAQLQHPGVPPVYHVGALPDGRPFLAMKLIKGRTLDEVLKARPSLAADRGRFLAVFEAVCQAVAYAHAHQVVHRDLKPSNVMVGTFGEVQVMDWGLAKVLTARGRPSCPPDTAVETAAGTAIRPARDADQETQAGSLLGTPAFMPPEQAIGAVDRIDARSDVFSLGGILCAVLTGRPPYVADTAEATRQLAARARLDDVGGRLDACGAEPGLIALCRRCLAPEPGDRPADAGAVADEVAGLRADAEQRAKEAELNEARAAVRAAEERKRRRARLGAGAGLLAVLLAGVAGTTAGLVRVDRARRQVEAERDKATRARDRARQVLDAMTSDLTGESLAAQKAVSREQKAFLASALGHYRELAAEQGDNRASRAQSAAAARRLGLIEARLGNNREAVSAFRQARDEYAALTAEVPDDLVYRRELATAHNDLGTGLLALGEPAEADFQASLAGFTALASEPTGTPVDRVNAAIARMNGATALAERGRAADAEAEFRRAETAFEALAAEHPEVPNYRRHLATVRNALGNLYKESRLRDLAKAEAAYRSALALRRALAAEVPDQPDYRADLAASHNNLGVLLDDTSRPDEAAEAHRAAIRLREQLTAEFPGAFEYRLHLGGSYGNLGRLYRKHGRPADGLEWFAKGVAILAPELDREPQHTTLRLHVRNIHAGWASALDRLGRHVEAVPHWDRAVEYSPPPQVGRHRALRAGSRARAGQTGPAVAEVAELAVGDGWDAGQLYDFACVYSMGSGKDAANREEYAGRAVELLRRAVAAGWKDAARLAKDPELDPLRGRMDFRELLASPKR